MIARCTLLAFDPGLQSTGWVVLTVAPHARRIEAAGSVRTDSAHSDDDRIRVIAASVMRLVEQWRPTVIGLEAYRWQGKERSSNLEAFRLSRLVGRLEGVAQAWIDGDVANRWLVTVDKAAANRAIGIHGRAPKGRVRRAVEAFFPNARLHNEHEVDAVAVAVAAHQRWSILRITELGARPRGRLSRTGVRR